MEAFDRVFPEYPFKAPWSATPLRIRCTKVPGHRTTSSGVFHPELFYSQTDRELWLGLHAEPPNVSSSLTADDKTELELISNYINMVHGNKTYCNPNWTDNRGHSLYIIYPVPDISRLTLSEAVSSLIAFQEFLGQADEKWWGYMDSIKYRVVSK